MTKGILLNPRTDVREGEGQALSCRTFVRQGGKVIDLMASLVQALGQAAGGRN